MQELLLLLTTGNLIISTTATSFFFFNYYFDIRQMKQDLSEIYDKLQMVEDITKELDSKSKMIMDQNRNIFCEVKNILEELDSNYHQLEDEDEDEDEEYDLEDLDNYWELDQYSTEDNHFQKLDEFYDNLFEAYKEKADKTLSKEEIQTYFDYKDQYKKMRL